METKQKKNPRRKQNSMVKNDFEDTFKTALKIHSLVSEKYLMAKRILEFGSRLINQEYANLIPSQTQVTDDLETLDIPPTPPSLSPSQLSLPNTIPTSPRTTRSQAPKTIPSSDFPSLPNKTFKDQKRILAMKGSETSWFFSSLSKRPLQDNNGLSTGGDQVKVIGVLPTLSLDSGKTGTLGDLSIKMNCNLNQSRDKSKSGVFATPRKDI